MLQILQTATRLPWACFSGLAIFLFVAFLIPPFTWYVRTPLVILLTAGSFGGLLMWRSSLDQRAFLKGFVRQADGADPDEPKR